MHSNKNREKKDEKLASQLDHFKINYFKFSK
jgi:hypothetical protein